LLLCLIELETEGIIDQFHIGFCGGHYAWRETTYKIFRGRSYWPTSFLQVGEMVKGCVPCQMFAGKQKLVVIPLVPSIVKAPFSQWGLDFVERFTPLQVISIDGSSLRQTALLNGFQKQFQSEMLLIQ